MNEAITERDAAIEKAEHGASVLFNHAADEAVKRAARTMPEFTTAQVKPLCNITPREGRAWAGVMRRACLAGLIYPTDAYRPSGDVTDHNRAQRVWASKIYRAAPPQSLFDSEPQNSYGSI